jgi:hypothetical protein
MALCTWSLFWLTRSQRVSNSSEEFWGIVTGGVPEVQLAYLSTNIDVAAAIARYVWSKGGENAQAERIRVDKVIARAAEEMDASLSLIPEVRAKAEKQYMEEYSSHVY